MSPAIRLTWIIGIALVLMGVGFYIGTGMTSITALIPAFIGGVLVICAAASRSAKATKIAMHFAALIALLGAAGSTRVFMKWADLPATARTAQLATFVLCIVLLMAYIRSFRTARRAGSGGAADG